MREGRKMRSKKGAITLAELPGAVILLVTIGILIGVGALILASMQDSQTTVTGSTVVINESEAITDGTGFFLDTFGGAVGWSGSITTVISGGNNTIVPATNYTFVDDFFTPQNSTLYGAGNLWNITYSYTETRQDFFYNNTNSAVTGLADLSSFQGIIAIVIAAAIIIGVVTLIRS